MHSSFSTRMQMLLKKSIHGLEAEFGSKVVEIFGLLILGYRLQDDAVSGAKVIQNGDENRQI